MPSTHEQPILAEEPVITEFAGAWMPMSTMNTPSKKSPDQMVFGYEAGPGLDIVARVDEKFRPVWEPLPPDHRAALAGYFLPHNSSKESLAPTRPRLIKWYCPFAAQATFPSGHRYCINTYTGCSHRCRYCYAAGYEPDEPSAKRDFATNLAKDLADLEQFDVPPAPVHLSNSTDPFQRELEERLGHTKLALEALLGHRRRFSTVTILTKNPTLAARQDYAQILADLGTPPADHPFAGRLKTSNAPAVQVEVSLAFWREEVSAFWDPGAPSVAERMEGIRALRSAGIPVVLRIDPLFPRSPLPSSPPRGLSDFGLVERRPSGI